jgi:heterodisulfide reductase subunit A
MAAKQSNDNEPRIGLYICHCGTNIAPKVNVELLADEFKNYPGVVISRHYMYMCSDPGQDLVKNDIKELGLNRVVVSSCSPTLHELTFRRACNEAGLNPFLFQMANIREHCSWVTEDTNDATQKARKIISAALKRVYWHEPLEYIKIDINPNVLVVGGGITGIEASLRLAGAGRNVYLVEREASIGGHMAELDKTFPTLDCAACILTPKMGEVKSKSNVKLMTYTEVKEVSGGIGSFKVKLRKKPRYVYIDRCNGCGACWDACPSILSPYYRRILRGDLIVNERKPA